jgi:hypothetical protein
LLLRLADLHLPPPRPRAPPALKGTLDLPSGDFELKRIYIEDNLFFTHRLLHRTIFKVFSR